MRRGLVLGACVGGLLTASVAPAQFASERTPPAFGGSAPPATTPPAKTAPAAQPPAASSVPQLPGGLQPAGYVAPPAPTGAAGKMLPNGVMLPDPTRKEPLAPVPTTIDETAGPHPWAAKADHGPWMICVKTYSGPESRASAEKLAADIRQTHRTMSFLFERNGEERRAEKARVEAVRKRQNDAAQPFLQIREQAIKEGEAKGFKVYDDEKPTIKVPKPYHEAPEQWAVLIGGFKDMKAAREALDVVKGLPMPKDVTLLERAMVGAEDKDKSGKSEWKSSSGYLNPYQYAMVVPNPAVGKQNMDDKGKLEPFVVEMNKGIEHSLLAAKKPWTIVLKSYSAPIKTVSQEGGGGSVFNRSGLSKDGANILRATAAEADLLVKALRHPEHKPRSYEAFVLHHRTGSLVTVGQFDSPDDPTLTQLADELRGITYEMRDKDQKPVIGADGRPQVQRLFDMASPFPVPKFDPVK